MRISATWIPLFQLSNDWRFSHAAVTDLVNYASCGSMHSPLAMLTRLSGCQFERLITQLVQVQSELGSHRAMLFIEIPTCRIRPHPESTGHNETQNRCPLPASINNRPISVECQSYFTTSILLRLSEMAMAAINRTPSATWLQDGGTPAIVRPFLTIVRVRAPMMVLITLP